VVGTVLLRVRRVLVYPDKLISEAKYLLFVIQWVFLESSLNSGIEGTRKSDVGFKDWKSSRY
jgi:hypothetical protein